MYKTIKELHIEIEQRLQQITSNRFGSMPPQFYDMMLNRTAIKYIQSKSNRKTNYKGEGLEDSMKRVEDFQSLKRETIWMPVIKDSNDSERGFVLLPSNYLKFITSTSKVQLDTKKVVDESEKDFKNVFYKVYPLTTINDDKTINNTTICGVDISHLFNSFDINVELPKYAVEAIYKQLNKEDKHFDVYWEYFNDRYYPNSIIVTSDHIFATKEEDGKQVNDVEVYTNQCFASSTSGTCAENDLIASENIRSTLNDFYGNRNRHKNPITELVNDKLYVYIGNKFYVSEIKITYLKTPDLFSSELNQMSDMTITPEFVDMVVSDILLILKDNTFNLVKQQSNIE